jgi:hypothetical protein
MTARHFRRIVLGLRDTVESAHMGHPDFRVNGRIFATLNHDETRGMVVLGPGQQDRFVRESPSGFEPESGAWGRSGCTRVHLAAVDEETLGEAATLAWQHCVAKGPARTSARKAARGTGSSGAPLASSRSSARRTRRKR